MPRALVLDPKASTLVIHTRAKGMLARLAHDLEIAATALRGDASLDGEAFTGRLSFDASSLEVTGVLRGDRDSAARPSVDRGVLSASDRAEIARRMREDGLRGAREVDVSASGSLARADLSIALGGREVRANASLDAADDGARVTVRSRVPLSLKALGAREIKGPLGAFVVSDDIVVWLEAAFAG